MTDIRTENRRWTILRLLSNDLGHESSARMIQKGLGALNRAHAKVGLDQVREDLRWLNQKMLITLVFEDDEVYATLVQRGHDCAKGNIVVDGVDEPPLRG